MGKATSSFDQHKIEITNEAAHILRTVENEHEPLKILREYNRWYTKALEFVNVHTKIRKAEFESIHSKVQENLSSENTDYKLLIANINILKSIIEGSSDHGPSIGYASL